MEPHVFHLSKVPDWKNNKVVQLQAYPEIKRLFFESAVRFDSKELSFSKFYREVILPRVPVTVKLTETDARRWYKRIQPFMQELLVEIKAQSLVRGEKTLLEKEHQKLIQQAEIRQDVVDVMHSYIQNLKEFVGDKQNFDQLSHKEKLELYRIIREEEDRSRGLNLKERAENRADAAFAFFVSQARAGQLNSEDIDLLEADVRQDLEMFKNQNGTYQLPTGILPKIQPATENIASQPA